MVSFCRHWRSQKGDPYPKSLLKGRPHPEKGNRERTWFLYLVRWEVLVGRCFVIIMVIKIPGDGSIFGHFVGFR